MKLVATLNGVRTTTTFNQTFTAIVFLGGSGNDSIQLAGSLTIPVTIRAGNGNDFVQLGKGNSTVTLGSGNDFVSGGDGNNTVSAGDGNDFVQLGNGNNNVTLGNGNDFVQLGNGNNVVVTGNGNDTILAGNGDNLIAAGLGQHYVQVGNGSNILIDGSVGPTGSGDSLRQVLSDWMTFGIADVANLRSRLSITYSTTHPNSLLAGKGLDWFFYTDALDFTNRKGTDLIN